MGVLPLFGFGSFVFASVVVGVRLLLLAWRTREVPELAIGIALLFGGGFGYLLVMLTAGIRLVGGPLAAAGLLIGAACLAIGASGLVFGMRAIFRPSARWARALAIGLTGVLALSVAGRCLDPMRIPSAPWIYWTTTGTSAVAYGWSAFESLRYASLLRKRARFGLADAWIAQRFLLWGVSASAAVGIHVTSIAGRILHGTSEIPPALLALGSLLGLTAAAGIWLAFFPPRRATALAKLS